MIVKTLNQVMDARDNPINNLFSLDRMDVIAITDLSGQTVDTEKFLVMDGREVLLPEEFEINLYRRVLTLNTQPMYPVRLCY